MASHCHWLNLASFSKVCRIAWDCARNKKSVGPKCWTYLISSVHGDVDFRPVAFLLDSSNLLMCANRMAWSTWPSRFGQGACSGHEPQSTSTRNKIADRKHNLLMVQDLLLAQVERQETSTAGQTVDCILSMILCDHQMQTPQRLPFLRDQDLVRWHDRRKWMQAVLREHDPTNLSISSEEDGPLYDLPCGE